MFKLQWLATILCANLCWIDPVLGVGGGAISMFGAIKGIDQSSTEDGYNPNPGFQSPTFDPSDMPESVPTAPEYIEERYNTPLDQVYRKLFANYHMARHVLPVKKVGDQVQVKVGITLIQLVNVDEKNQIMTTNVWVNHEWHDSKLRWNPNEYGGVKKLHVPIEMIWAPDTIIYNNADGEYQLTTRSKATIHYNGKIRWEPPAIYKSFCAIDVAYFPFDDQECYIKLGPWTYNMELVDYRHLDNHSVNHIEWGMDMSKYYPSVEWDVLAIPADRHEISYVGLETKYVDITYTLRLRRKTLFYTVNLIIPCVAIALLTIMVFYLPSDSSEKITLSISILLALTVFILLLSEIIPPTSLAVPLIGKYLLFTILLITLSIICTIVVLTSHFRHERNYHMPDWVKRLFLVILTKLLRMKHFITEEIDQIDEEDFNINGRYKNHHMGISGALLMPVERRSKKEAFKEQHENLESLELHLEDSINPILHAAENFASGANKPPCDASTTYRLPTYTGYQPVHQAETKGGINVASGVHIDQLKKIPPATLLHISISYLNYVVFHFKRRANITKMTNEWKVVAHVMDRLLLILFCSGCFLGSIGILLRAPSLYESMPISQKNFSRM